MNYQKIYDNLMNRAIAREVVGYVEEHHIVPKCIGGSNDKSNLVMLYPEEHYVAHQLLVKIHPTHYGLVSAAMFMTGHSTTEGRMNNKLFGWLRKRASLLTKGVPKREETKVKMRKPKSEEHCDNISKAQLANGGNGPEQHSDETKKKISEWSEQNSVFKLTVKCPHCETEGKQGPMMRFHFDNCIEVKPRKPMRTIQCPHCLKTGGVSAMKQRHFDKCKDKKEEYVQSAI